MTYSKTCQIDNLFLIVKLKHSIVEEYDYSNKPMKSPIQLLPCAGKAKHSVTVRTGMLGYRDKIKFRLCNTCFGFIYRIYKDNPHAISEGLSIEDDDIPIIRFRRNRL